jgi:hypothetical protein
MQSIQASPLLNAVGRSERRFMALLCGAVVTAILTGFVAIEFGEVVAALALVLLLLMGMSIGNFHYGILMSVFLLPLGATALIPREMFGMTGLNPLNAALAFSSLSLFLIGVVQPGRVSYPQWPGHFWVFVAVMALGAFHGAMYVDEIPEYFRILQVIKFDSVGGYLVDTFLKPMLTLVVAYIYAIAVRNAARPTVCLIPLFASTLILPVSVIYLVAMSGESLLSLASSNSRGFLSVVGMHANELGLLFNMMFALTLFCAFSVTGALQKWVLGLISLTLAVAIALTFSRGAYLGFLVVVMYLQFSQRRFRTTAFVLLLCVMAVLFMPDAMKERAFSGMAQGDTEGVSAGRVAGIWIPLVADIVSSPIIGNGRGSILWSDAAQHLRILPIGHPHSAYIGAVLDYGMLGAMVIFSFLWHMWCFFKTFAERSVEGIWRGFFRGAMACILLLLVQGVTDDSFTPTGSQPFLWMAYAVAVGLMSRVYAQARVASYATTP